MFFCKATRKIDIFFISLILLTGTAIGLGLYFFHDHFVPKNTVIVKKLGQKKQSRKIRSKEKKEKKKTQIQRKEAFARTATDPYCKLSSSNKNAGDRSQEKELASMPMKPISVIRRP